MLGAGLGGGGGHYLCDMVHACFHKQGIVFLSSVPMIFSKDYHVPIKEMHVFYVLQFCGTDPTVGIIMRNIVPTKGVF